MTKSPCIYIRECGNRKSVKFNQYFFCVETATASYDNKNLLKRKQSSKLVEPGFQHPISCLRPHIIPSLSTRISKKKTPQRRHQQQIPLLIGPDSRIICHRCSPFKTPALFICPRETTRTKISHGNKRDPPSPPRGTLIKAITTPTAPGETGPS